MTRTVVLMILIIICTDSVLKDVLSATGDDRQLRKIGNGNKKYGPFRNVLVPESMRRTKISEYDPETPAYPPMEICGRPFQACAIVEKNGTMYGLTRLCHCPAGKNCAERWEENVDSVTLKDPEFGDVYKQFKFCNLTKVAICTKKMRSGTLIENRTIIGNTNITRWFYRPLCLCRNYTTYARSVKPLNNNKRKYFLVCDKPMETCGYPSQACAIVKKNGTTYGLTRLCHCPAGKTCIERWEENVDSMTLKDPEFHDVYKQFKFCNLTKVAICTKKMRSGTLIKNRTIILDTNITRWFYRPRCLCRNYITYARSLKPLSNNKWKYFLVCGKQEVEMCEDNNQACAKVERINDGFSWTSLCNCRNLTDTDCMEAWERNAASVTFRNPEDKNAQTQLKFCNQIQLDKCTTEKIAGILKNTEMMGSMERWRYEPACHCHNYYTQVDILDRADNVELRSLVCDKPRTSSNSGCAHRFFYSFTSVNVTKYSSNFTKNSSNVIKNNSIWYFTDFTKYRFVCPENEACNTDKNNGIPTGVSGIFRFNCV